MEPKTADFARAVSEAYREIVGFAATQTVRAGAIFARAKVRVRRPAMCAVEYESYESPLSDLEEQLVNGAEFTPDELVGMSLVHNGRETLVFDPSHSIAVLKPSRSLFEPLPGFQALGEIGFVDRLTHDFLLRDAGEETIAGRETRLLGLKPKQPARSHLLKTVSFPIRRAVVAFDKATKLPLRIRFHPSPTTLLSTFLRPDEPVTIEYSGVVPQPPSSELFSLAPPKDVRLFRESFVEGTDLPDALPFHLPLDRLFDREYRLAEGGGVVTLDEEKTKGYCTIQLRTTQGPARILTLRAGNFLSRNMSRRRATLAEKGEQVAAGPIDGYLLDRGSSWPQDLSNSEERDLIEIFWTEDSRFWFLAGDGIDRSELLDLAATLASRDETSED